MAPFQALPGAYDLPLADIAVGQAQADLVEAIRAATPQAVLAGIEASLTTVQAVYDAASDEGERLALDRQVGVFAGLVQLAIAVGNRDRIHPPGRAS